MDRFTNLGVFVAAVEEDSLAAAARHSGLSAAMTGEHVSAIEAGLNARLLHRTTRRLSLTDIGQIYYRRCKRTLEAFDEVRREASDSQGAARGVLRIAASVISDAMRLGEVVARYMEDHSNVTVEAQLGDRCVGLIDAGADVAIRIGRLRVPGLVTRRLTPCRMVVCVSPAYLERHGTSHRSEELLDAQRLVFSKAVSTGDWTLHDHEDRVHITDGPCRMVTSNIQILFAAAVTGVGIAYGPTFVLGGHIRRGGLVGLPPAHRPMELTTHAVYLSTQRVPSKVRRFVDYLIETFGDDPPWDREGISQGQSREL